MQFGCGFFETTIKAKAKQTGVDILSQSLENLKFIKAECLFFTIQKSIYLGLEGSLGFLGRGDLTQKVSWDTFGASNCYYTKGKSADLGVQFGYKFYLTPYHLNVTTLMPRFGYSGFFMKIDDNTMKKKCSVSNSPSFTHSNSSLKQIWYGPYLGGALEIKTYQGFSVTMSYDYYFFSLRNSSFTSYKLIENSLELLSKKDYNGGYGHHPKLSVSFDLNPIISLGASLNYLYFKEKCSSTPVKNVSDCLRLNTSGSYQREDLSAILFIAFQF